MHHSAQQVSHFHHGLTFATSRNAANTTYQLKFHDVLLSLVSDYKPNMKTITKYVVTSIAFNLHIYIVVANTLFDLEPQ